MASMGKSAGLMVMLMLAALVVSAQAGGREVTCENKLKNPIKCNGKDVAPGGNVVVLVQLDDILQILVKDKNGHWVPTQCKVQPGVIKVVVKVNAAGLVVVVVAAVGGLLGGLLNYLLGAVLVAVYVLL